MDPVRAGLLIDFYGNLLTERNRLFMELYFSEDMSLSEIADIEGVSRQAVHDSIHRGLLRLTQYEEKLGLVLRFLEHKKSITTAIQLLDNNKYDDARIVMRNIIDQL